MASKLTPKERREIAELADRIVADNARQMYRKQELAWEAWSKAHVGEKEPTRDEYYAWLSARAALPRLHW